MYIGFARILSKQDMKRLKLLTQYLVNHRTSKPPEGEWKLVWFPVSVQFGGRLGRLSVRILSRGVLCMLPVNTAVMRSPPYCSLLLPSLFTGLWASQAWTGFLFPLRAEHSWEGQGWPVFPMAHTFRCFLWVPVTLFSYGLASFTLKRKARMGKRKGGRGREGTERKGMRGEGKCVEPTMSPCTEVLELYHTKSLSSGSLQPSEKDRPTRQINSMQWYRSEET